MSQPHFDSGPATQNQATETDASVLSIIAEADRKFPSERNPGPTRVEFELSSPTIKEEPQSPGHRQFTHGLGGTAVRMDHKQGLEEHDYQQDQSKEHQKQDDTINTG